MPLKLASNIGVKLLVALVLATLVLVDSSIGASMKVAPVLEAQVLPATNTIVASTGATSR